GPKVAEWMSTYLGRQIWPIRGWKYLRYIGYTPQGAPTGYHFVGLDRPRPRHEKARAGDGQSKVNHPGARQHRLACGRERGAGGSRARFPATLLARARV